MKMRVFLAAAAACLSAASFPSTAAASGSYFVENLSRGLVALRSSDTTVYVGWRLLGSDPSDLEFNLYRTAGDGQPQAAGRNRRRPTASPAIRARECQRKATTRRRTGREGVPAVWDGRLADDASLGRGLIKREATYWCDLKESQIASMTGLVQNDR